MEAFAFFLMLVIFLMTAETVNNQDLVSGLSENSHH
jgi:hypothetical protein